MTANIKINLAYEKWGVNIMEEQDKKKGDFEAD
jgi:hypothetical protein